MAYDRALHDGPIGQELYQVRNYRQAYQQGLVRGMMHTALQLITRGRGLVERYPAQEDHRLTARLAAWNRPAPPRLLFDGTRLFDKVSDVYHSGTRHDENQPPHLVVVDPDLCGSRCRTEYGNPCESFCPAGVYEMRSGGTDGVRMHLNFSNCVHCKICDVADPYGVIYWVPAEGGEGPRYRNT
jgi:electron-transferring-flavoprotein dehydrogenase